MRYLHSSEMETIASYTVHANDYIELHSSSLRIQQIFMMPQKQCDWHMKQHICSEK